MKIPSFEIIGNKEKAVVILEIPENLQKKQKQIAKNIIEKNKSVKTVLKKTSERKGKLRLRQYKILLGQNNTEVIHKEHGCLFKLDPRKAYFSPRESTERQRLASLTKPNEEILVMFSGVSPIPIVLAKKNPKIKNITAIELNKTAYKYAKENILLNELTDKIKLIQGDVKKVLPKLNKFDRIIMPLPKEAYQYLDLAFSCLKKKSYIHFYYWANESDLFTEAISFIKTTAKKHNKKTKIINKKKVLPYGPRKWKIVLDILVY